jgi:hypothetical protein
LRVGEYKNRDRENNKKQTAGNKFYRWHGEHSDRSLPEAGQTKNGELVRAPRRFEIEICVRT